MQPVECFATLADVSKSHFNGDVRDLLWAMTIVLDDFDANRGAIWRQAPTPYFGIDRSYSPFFIEQDWLPYMNNPDKNKTWCDPRYKDAPLDKHCAGKWTYSLRGVWNTKYWDKTANQAYHFWFYVAVAFFDGKQLAEFANDYHDPEGEIADYDFSGSNPEEAPIPPYVSTKPDRALALQGVALGNKLAYEYWLQEQYGNCNKDYITLPATDLGNWLRTNLK